MSNINLLPPNIKESIEQKKKNSMVLGLFYKSLIYALIIIVVTVGAYIYLENNTNNIAAKLAVANEQINGYGQLEEQSTRVSEKLLAIKTIEKKLNHWTDVVAEVQKVMPSGVYLSKTSLNADNKIRGEISGFAKTKNGIATLRDAMEKSEYFEYVDIEEAATETNPKTGEDLESFTLTFSLQKGALDE